MKDFSDAEKQIVEKKHDGRRHQKIQQLRALLLQRIVDRFESDLVYGQNGDNDHARQNQKRLDEIGADHCPEAAEKRVADADNDNDRHSVVVRDSGKGVNQDPASHAHADEPAKAVEKGNCEEYAPGYLAVSKPDEVAAGIAARHQASDPRGERSEHQQPDGSQRVAEHAPDAHLQRDLRCRHRGIAGHPGGHGGGCPEGETHVPPGQDVIIQLLAASPPIPSQSHP